MRHLIFALLLSSLPPVMAEESATFNAALATGAKCKIDVSLLHPTQFAVGMTEVNLRIEKCRQMSAKALDHYLRVKTAPVVIGPRGIPYIVDHHHLARALLDGKISPFMLAEIKANWSNLSEAEFWQRMNENHWVHPYDENGNGPLDVRDLPKSLAGLRDDPFRSLAWAVQHQGGYQDNGEFFLDFKWADFFRHRLTIGTGQDGFEKAVDQALELAKSAEAKSLPGFAGKK